MRRRSLSAVVTVALALAISPAAAQAEFGIAPGSFTAKMLDSAGDPESRAGAHPDRLQLGFDFNATSGGAADGNVKDIAIDLPQGLVGDPRATAVCSRELAAVITPAECPPESQIGTVDLLVGGVGTLTVPIYNAQPRPGNLAEFGIPAFFISIYMTARVAPDGQGLSMDIAGAVQDIPLTGMRVELWGVPADHQVGAASPRRPFLTAPTRCDIAPTVTARARSWQEQGVWRSASAQTGPLSGCESLSFDPRLELRLESAASDTPTAAELSLLLPQSDDADGQSVDRIDTVALELPAGMALSPGAANGLTACSEQDVGLASAAPASCPPSSRVGTVELTTPLLADPVAGGIYMGGQLPGTDYRLFVVASGPGLDVKIPFSLHADPDTGRLSTRMSGLPPLPFDRLTLRFDGGPRAPLVTPPSCGAAVASATFAPLGGGAAVASSDAVTISSSPSGAPCPVATPFAPSFVAGVSNARAGAASPFAMTIRRRDGEQPLDRFRMALPAGLSARLGKAERCSEAALAAAACPAASRVGAAVAEVGSGASPLPMRGDVFLTGPYRSTRPYRRTPFGLAIAFRGVAGPFDLGTVMVRAALGLDPRSGQVTIDSDPLPRIRRGIPLRMQTIAIDVDRPGFIVNPTSCAPTRVTAALESTGGVVVRPESRFAVAGCRALRFRPRLAMALIGRSELRAGGNPRVRLRIRPTRRGANIRQASVAMPKLLGASPTGPAAICSLEQADDGRCPRKARIGSASGRTPLLSSPLRGSVYLVQPARGLLPDVWALMRGMGVELKLRMRLVLGDDGQLHGKLVDLPDLPLSAFAMTFAGGERGMFSLTRTPCAGRRARAMLAKARLTAHNGSIRSLETRVRAAGC